MHSEGSSRPNPLAPGTHIYVYELHGQGGRVRASRRDVTKDVSSPDPVAWIRCNVDTELVGAIESLRGRRPDLHGARKRLKRSRAGLRLLREVFGDTAYRKHNRALRDAARLLSQARDAQVLLLTLNDVAGDTLRSGRKLARLRSALRAEQLKHQRAAARAAAAVSTRIDRTRLNLSEQALHVRQAGWAPVVASLRRTYGHGRKALTLAKKKAGAEHLHEWRKQVKYYWHQIETIGQRVPRIGGKEAKKLHKLSDYLGDDHDLFVLKTRLARSRDRELDKATRSQLETSIDRERKSLQRKAFRLGSRLYSAKPKQVQQRVADHWPPQ